VIQPEAIAKLHKVLLTMHFLSATSSEASISIKDLARHIQSMNEEEIREVLKSCIELDYVYEVNGRYYLTYKGLISALSISS